MLSINSMYTIYVLNIVTLGIRRFFEFVSSAFFRQMFECPHCPKKFALRRTLGDHIKKKHPNAVKVTGNEDMVENVILPGNEEEEKAKFSTENQIAIENLNATGSEVVVASEVAAENQVMIKNENMLKIEVMAKNDDAMIEVMAENDDAMIEVMAKNSKAVINEVMIENKYVAGDEFAAGTSKYVGLSLVHV